MMNTDPDALPAERRGSLMQAPPGKGLDRIARLAARQLGTPMAAVGLCGEACLWLVSRVGLLPPMVPGGAPPAEIAVPDLLADPAHQGGLLAQTGVRFWAAAPIVSAQGAVRGAVCVMDHHPRPIGPEDLASLQDLAALAGAVLELNGRGGRLDLVSGLPNRQRLIEELDGLETASGDARLLVVVDLASPEEVSRMLETVGSAGLDTIVRDRAQGLCRLVGPTVAAYHLGVLQFALLTGPDADAGLLTQRLQQDLPRLDGGRGGVFSTTCTSGVAVVTPGQAGAEDWLLQAFAALDDARMRRAPVGLFSPDQEAAGRRALRLIQDFAAALSDENSLHLVFQPRLDLASERCVGAEALLRWTHPELGEIAPGEFVRLIERTTMARGMMRWVLAHALAQARAWRESGIVLQVSVNVSPANLDEHDFAAHVLESLAAAGLPPNSLELEVTESALLDEATPAMQQLRQLSAAGVHIAIDDFGTGYSSLSYLQRLPADVVKIDQSFVRGLTPDGVDEGRRRTLVSAMIELSHELGYRVVAEGIETQPAADALLMLDCDEVQGYHFARPMPPAAFQAWYSQRLWPTARPASLLAGLAAHPRKSRYMPDAPTMPPPSTVQRSGASPKVIQPISVAPTNCV